MTSNSQSQVNRHFNHSVDGYDLQFDWAGDGTKRGGFGVVWRYNVKANCTRRSVLKIVDLNKIGEAESDATQAKMRLLAKREAQILVRLHHPHIVKMFHTWEGLNNSLSFGTGYGKLYIEQELCDGGTLKEAIDDQRDINKEPFKIEQIKNWLTQMASAISYIHDLGVVHCDLSPSNIMFQDESKSCVKLIDFGAAKLVGTSSALVSKAIGKANYMAPEAFDSNNPLSRQYNIDVWALGAIAFDLATFSPPTVFDICHESKVKLNQISSSYTNSSLRELIEQMLLVVEVGKRAKMDQVIQHPFFRTQIIQLNEQIVQHGQRDCLHESIRQENDKKHAQIAEMEKDLADYRQKNTKLEVQFAESEANALQLENQRARLETQLAHFAGTWKLDASDNFDAYMKEIGISWYMRQMANSSKPTIVITVDGNHFSIKEESTISTTVNEFDLDVEFDEKIADGRKCKSTFSLTDDGKLVQVQKGKVDSNFTRWVEGDTLVIECECSGVKAVRKFKRQ